MVRSTKWFESYLGNRSHLVNIRKPDSDSAVVTCCVPQESILGHLLFLCYVNDIVEGLDGGGGGGGGSGIHYSLKKFNPLFISLKFWVIH